MLGQRLPAAVTPRGLQLCGQGETEGSDLKVLGVQGPWEEKCGREGKGQTILSEGTT